MKFLISIYLLLVTISSLNANALDITKACEELEEQKKSLLSKFSTSLTEAKMAGQCIGYSAISSNKAIDLNKPCTEFIEQKNNLFGSFSTSLKEANQSGVCIGAIYGACGTVNFTDAAQRVVDKISSSTTKRRLRSVVDCNG
jgi:hypothetical protein